MSTKGGPLFAFSLPGGAARPLAPLSVTPLLVSTFTQQNMRPSTMWTYGCSLNYRTFAETRLKRL